MRWFKWTIKLKVLANSHTKQMGISQCNGVTKTLTDFSALQTKIYSRKWVIFTTQLNIGQGNFYVTCRMHTYRYSNMMQWLFLGSKTSCISDKLCFAPLINNWYKTALALLYDLLFRSEKLMLCRGRSFQT